MLPSGWRKVYGNDDSAVLSGGLAIDDQDWPRAKTDDALGGGTDHHSAQGVLAMRPEHDEVRCRLFCPVENVHVVPPNENVHFDSGGWGAQGWPEVSIY